VRARVRGSIGTALASGMVWRPHRGLSGGIRSFGADEPFSRDVQQALLIVFMAETPAL